VRHRQRLAPGSLLFIFFIWYGAVRFALETLRTDNWILLGIPTAQIVSVAFMVVGVLGLLWRNSGPAGRRSESDEPDELDAEVDGADFDDDPVADPHAGDADRDRPRGTTSAPA
jgi:hypothetical protein